MTKQHWNALLYKHIFEHSYFFMSGDPSMMSIHRYRRATTKSRFWINQPLNTDHTMIYAHHFTSEKVHKNILHLGLEWLFFHLHIHLKYINYRCMVKLKPFYWLSLCTGLAVAGVRTSGTSHFAIRQSFSTFACSTNKAIWSKKKLTCIASSRKQI